MPDTDPEVAMIGASFGFREVRIKAFDFQPNTGCPSF